VDRIGNLALQKFAEGSMPKMRTPSCVIVLFVVFDFLSTRDRCTVFVV